MSKLENSEKLLKEYEKYIFRLTPFHKPVMRKGKGVWLEDVDGNKYLDLMSGQFSLPFGHSQESFVELLNLKARKILHTNDYFLSEEVLFGAKELATITDKSLKKITFLSTGAEAIEFAIRHAKFYTGKEGVVSLTRGYHGLTLAAQSITNEGLYAKPMVPMSYHLPTPSFYEDDENFDLDRYFNSVKKNLVSLKGKISAFVFEPVISVGGMIFPPKEFFVRLKKIAEEHEALFIFDECQTGFGRTGKWFGYEHMGVVPDILVLAKVAGIGFPTSIVVMKNDIATALEGKIMHFSSHQNDPISGATVEFLIQYMKKNNTLDTIIKVGSYLLQALTELSKEQLLLRYPRGLGFMVGFNLPEEIFKRDYNPGHELMNLLEENGILVQATRKGRVFRILPSYEITEQEIDVFTNTLKVCLGKLVKKL